MDRVDVTWICAQCGIAHGTRNPTGDGTTWHHGTCDYCGKERSLTSGRKFGLYYKEIGDESISKEEK